jgi:hypothetical protein
MSGFSLLALVPPITISGVQTDAEHPIKSKNPQLSTGSSKIVMMGPSYTGGGTSRVRVN